MGRRLMIKTAILADKVGLTDPDTAWLLPWWVYKATVFFGIA